MYKCCLGVSLWQSISLSVYQLSEKLALTEYAMFSFAMTSGLASDSDKFKIIITLRRAQKFGDSGPYKNFDFLYNPLMTKVFIYFYFIYFIYLLESIFREYFREYFIFRESILGRAGLRKEVGLLRPGPRGPKVLRHQMVRWCAGGTEYPKMVTPAMRTTAVLLGFFYIGFFDIDSFMNVSMLSIQVFLY